MGPVKALANLEKHAVDQAATVFLDALALTVYDTTSSLSEDRWFTLGFDTTGQLLAVAHTYRADASETDKETIRVRIISARKATKQERRFYHEEPR